MSLGDHVVAIGFVMTFSPFQFELILALTYLIVKVVYEIRLHKSKSELKICKTGSVIINQP